MAGARGASKTADLALLVAVGTVVYFTQGDRFSVPVWVLFGLTVLSVWATFFMPTTCDYRTELGKPCNRRARGELRGCRMHARAKRDAVFRALSFTNRGAYFRMSWSSTGDTSKKRKRASSSSEEDVSDSRWRSGYDVSMLAVSALGSLASTLALFE